MPIVDNSPLTSDVQVSLLAAPVILGSEVAQYGRLGDTVHVECESRSVPEVRHFTWQLNGDRITKDSPVISIVESRHGSSVKSTIVIKNAEKEHFGDYVCGVENELGSTQATIKLRELGKKYFPSFEPVTADMLHFNLLQ